MRPGEAVATPWTPPFSIGGHWRLSRQGTNAGFSEEAAQMPDIGVLFLSHERVVEQRTSEGAEFSGRQQLGQEHEPGHAGRNLPFHVLCGARRRERPAQPDAGRRRLTRSASRATQPEQCDHSLTDRKHKNGGEGNEKPPDAMTRRQLRDPDDEREKRDDASDPQRRHVSACSRPPRPESRDQPENGKGQFRARRQDQRQDDGRAPRQQARAFTLIGIVHTRDVPTARPGITNDDCARWQQAQSVRESDDREKCGRARRAIQGF